MTKKKIERLNINNTIIEDANKILSELHKYFKDVLSTKITNIDHEKILEFMSNNENMTILSNLDSINLDIDLANEEFETATKDMSFNKTPGTDGLPIEWYIVFWLKIKNIFIASIKFGLHTGKLSTTQREGLISLLRKKIKTPFLLKTGDHCPS